jgi:hypothetical protein
MYQRNAQRGVSTRTVPSRSKWHLASLLLLGAAVSVFTGQARAEDDPGALQSKAMAGQVADVGSTAVGLALGAAEANPLGILTLGVKAIAYQQIKEAPAAEQPAMWSAYGAFGWGAAANNVCVLAAIATGGAAAALCPLVGLVTGMTVYGGDEEKRNRDTFAAICEEQRQINPKITCEYRGSNG